MKSRSVAGFGLLQVMIGTVVLGIFAMVFVRKAYNRADVGLLTELITYRDQVLDYYAAVIQSRTAWQCTRRCSGSPTSTAPPVSFNLYDGDKDCQAGCPTTKTLRLPRQGWRFSMADNNTVFVPPSWTVTTSSTYPTGVGNTGDTHPFFVKVEWQKTDATTSSSVKVTISIDFSPTNVWREDYTTMDVGSRKRVFYMNRTPYKNCADGLAASFGGNRFYSSETAGIPRYAGDTAVVAIDATTGLVECWNSPLVIPPCYRPNQFPFTSPSSSDSANTLDFVASQACGWVDQGLCPKIGSGTTGITHFDNFTGISHCARNHILMVERGGFSGVNCESVGKGGLVGVSDDGKFICSNDTGVIGGTGVGHNEASACPYGIQGWDQYGNVKCANRDWRGSDWEVNANYGANISFGDGYWVGDKGDKGCKGNSIRSCNCCKFPQHCIGTSATQWTSLTTPCTHRKNCNYRGDSTLKNDFKGCQARTCSSHGCPALASCEAVCRTCIATRLNQDTTCRNYRSCLSDCSTCRGDSSKCSSDRSSYSSCESTRRSCESSRDACIARNDPDEDCGSCDGCSSEYSDLDDCLDTECSTECNCGTAPTCPPSNLSNCIVSDCNDSSDTDKSEYDTDNCASKSFRETRFPFSGQSTTLGTACSRCTTYNTRCRRAETYSKYYKNEWPYYPSKIFSTCPSTDTKTRCP